MTKLLTITTILLIATSTLAQTYTVERVIDGDTIKLTNGEEVQLIGIKAPEDEKMGREESIGFLKGLGLEGKEVRLAFDVQERDKNERHLAYVYLEDCDPYKILFGHRYLYKDDTRYLETKRPCTEIFVNASIISSGYSSPMTISPNVKHDDLFQKLYKVARERHRGLWAEGVTEGSFLLRFDPERPVKEIPIPMH